MQRDTPLIIQDEEDRCSDYINFDALRLWSPSSSPSMTPTTSPRLMHGIEDFDATTVLTSSSSSSSPPPSCLLKKYPDLRAFKRKDSSIESVDDPMLTDESPDFTNYSSSLSLDKARLEGLRAAFVRREHLPVNSNLFWQYLAKDVPSLRLGVPQALPWPLSPIPQIFDLLEYERDPSSTLSPPLLPAMTATSTFANKKNSQKKLKQCSSGLSTGDAPTAAAALPISSPPLFRAHKKDCNDSPSIVSEFSLSLESADEYAALAAIRASYLIDPHSTPEYGRSGDATSYCLSLLTNSPTETLAQAFGTTLDLTSDDDSNSSTTTTLMSADFSNGTTRKRSWSDEITDDSFDRNDCKENDHSDDSDDYAGDADDEDDNDVDYGEDLYQEGNQQSYYGCLHGSKTVRTDERQTHFLQGGKTHQTGRKRKATYKGLHAANSASPFAFPGPSSSGSCSAWEFSYPFLTAPASKSRRRLELSPWPSMFSTSSRGSSTDSALKKRKRNATTTNKNNAAMERDPSRSLTTNAMGPIKQTNGPGRPPASAMNPTTRSRNKDYLKYKKTVKISRTNFAYECSACPSGQFRFELDRQLKRHAVKHLYEENKKFRCWGCPDGNTFNRIDALRRHFESAKYQACFDRGLYEYYNHATSEIETRMIGEQWRRYRLEQDEVNSNTVAL